MIKQTVFKPGHLHLPDLEAIKRARKGMKLEFIQDTDEARKIHFWTSKHGYLVLTQTADQADQGLGFEPGIKVSKRTGAVHKPLSREVQTTVAWIKERIWEALGEMALLYQPEAPDPLNDPSKRASWAGTDFFEGATEREMELRAKKNIHFQACLTDFTRDFKDLPPGLTDAEKAELETLEQARRKAQDLKAQDPDLAEARIQRDQALKVAREKGVQVSTMAAHTKTLVARDKDQGDQILKLKHQLDQTEAQVQELTQALGSDQAAVNLSKQLQALHRDHMEAQVALEDSQDQISILKDQIRQKKGLVKDLQDKLAEALAHMDQAHRSQDTLVTMGNGLAQDLQELREQAQALTLENQQALTQYGQAQDQLAVLGGLVADLGPALQTCLGIFKQLEDGQDWKDLSWDLEAPVLMGQLDDLVQAVQEVPHPVPHPTAGDGEADPQDPQDPAHPDPQLTKATPVAQEAEKELDQLDWSWIQELTRAIHTQAPVPPKIRAGIRKHQPAFALGLVDFLEDEVGKRSKAKKKVKDLKTWLVQLKSHVLGGHSR